MPSAKQPHPFDPRKAAMLDDPERERCLPTEALLRLLHVPPAARVLDYGAGTARYAIALGRVRRDVRVIAFDVQEPMLALARERVAESGLSNVEVAGPAPGTLHGPFERILALNVLHELEDEDVERIRGLLTGGGFAFFIDWNAAVPRDFGPPAGHTYTAAEAIGRLGNAGFSAGALHEPAFPYHWVLMAERADECFPTG